MANSFTLLADIKAGRCSITAEVRLLRFWESPNVKRGSKLMGVDMLLIDKQSTLMEGSVSVNLLSIFIERFSEGSVYTMCEFEETIDDIDYKRKGGWLCEYIPRRSNKHGVQLNRVVTIVLMVLYTWRESSSIKGISDGDNKTDFELPDGVSGEVRESTNANHQPSSSVVPGGGRLASTKPVDGLNENGEKARMAQLHVKKHSSPLNFLLFLCLPFIFLSDKALATLIYFLLNPIQRWMF
ncbi:BnaC01g43780D [Brassica napus]|uniref:BnaC01g43780D protein n=1 Tax=Brassica napus TaxID=3708 RepID=A0A078J5W9_BRANA|nr:BnaC01g43780D [Brassica napus]